MTKIRSSKKRKPGSSLLSFCFTGSPVSDPDIPSEVRGVRSGRKAWFSWPRKRKTVPVEEFLAGPSGLPDPKTSPEKSSKNGSKGRHRRQPPQEPAAKPQSCHVRRAIATATECIARSQPAPLISVRDQAQTMTRISLPGLPEHSQAASASPATRHKEVRSKKREGTAAERNISAGIMLLFMTTTLTILMLYGRASAILCTCTWFYLLPSLRAPAMPPVDSKSKKGSGKMDVNSKEYKKKVILEGLLERQLGRRSSTLSPPASAHLR